jgi:triacylglycerol lipase
MNIVLHHGLFGFGTQEFGGIQVEYFKGVPEALEANGHRTFATGVNPVGTIKQRCQQLLQHLRLNLAEIPNNEPVVLIAHSMGGLDARELLATAEPNVVDRIAALVTIATPHRGSPVADWVVRFNEPVNPLHLPDPLHAVGNVLRRAAPAKIVPLQVPEWVQWLGLDHDAIPDLTTASCAIFSGNRPNRKGVRYFWLAADCTGNVPLFFKIPSGIVSQDTGPSGGDNDGIVAVKSAEPPADPANPWASLGVWKGVDHLNAVNMRLLTDLHRPNVAPRYVQLVETVRQALGA